MGAFTYTNYLTYLGNGDTANDPIPVIENGTLDDGDSNGTFESGDTVTATPSASLDPSTGEYLGTAIVNGQEWPVFYFAATNETQIYLTETPVTFDSVLQVNENDLFDAPCFLAGTLIATPDGQTPVEALKIGDDILTADGAVVAVRWVGRQVVSTRFAAAERLMPVRILAAALGGGLPLRDLTLTADHAMMIDGLLVNAGALVNGTTVVFVPRAELGDDYTVYHVETEGHEIILAEGAPTETYIDYVGRQAFVNHAEYLALYGADRAITEMTQPRITSARQLPAALRALLAAQHAA